MTGSGTRISVALVEGHAGRTEQDRMGDAEQAQAEGFVLSSRRDARRSDVHGPSNWQYGTKADGTNGHRG
jgi:hypothetical protein